ncbi:MAG: RagB/SusD family nutrient uptake outer membrane protein, partial [Bacteroidales bacterium]|nr:RagB/SusD family nutrient uptake outer membrane protein [Bacteroidales bacterium]
SLKDTYDFIEADLNEALKIETPLMKIGSTNKYNSVRANKAAVNGFAARYYLYLNDYENALKYADIALQSHDELVDYNTEMSYMASCPTVTINGNTEIIEVPYTYEGGAGKINDYMLEWKELTYFRMASDDNWWYMPSDELLALYDQEYDLRYKYHIVENFSFVNNVTTALPSYAFFWKDRIPSGPTTAEMLLIKAECQARLGKASDAMTTVNRLRAARMDKSAPADVINLAASSQEDAVKKVLEERRREMPFARRFMDIRRLNSNECSYDDPGDITKTFYEYSLVNINVSSKKTYTLEKNSAMYACPLPETEFIASDYVIDQNIY